MGRGRLPARLAALPGAARLRWARPWLLTYVVWTAVGHVDVGLRIAAAMLVSGLWYGTRERVRTMMLPAYGVLAVAGACALAIVVHRLPGEPCAGTRGRVPGARAGRRGRRRPARRDGQRGRAAARHPRAPAGRPGAAYAGRGVVPADVRLAGPPHRLRRRRRRTTGNLELMTWSYADDGVLPLFGIPPLRAEQRQSTTSAAACVGLAGGQPGGARRAGAWCAGSACSTSSSGRRGCPAGRSTTAGRRLAGEPAGRPGPPRRRHPGLRGQRGRPRLPRRALTRARVQGLMRYRDGALAGA